MQIAQFIIDLGCLYLGVYSDLAAQYLPQLPHFRNCQGPGGPAARFSAFLITCYLGLFVNFYIQTYKKSGQRSTGKFNGGSVSSGKTD